MSSYKELYGAEYYESYGHSGKHYLSDTNIRMVLAGLSGFLIGNAKPKTHLDVGCALGLLVAAMRKRGVESYGIDVSEYAIESAVREARRFVTVLDITEDIITAEYDLVTCVEVIEHVPPELESDFLDALCSISNVIYFSSDNDTTEPTHVNPHPNAYWIERFAERGYLPDSQRYALIPWGRLYRKAVKPADTSRLLDNETRAEVLQRDEFRCVLCGASGVQVHEIVPRSFFGSKDKWQCFVPKNRICLCPSCHSEAHTVSGRVQAIQAMTSRYGYEYQEQFYQKYLQEKE